MPQTPCGIVGVDGAPDVANAAEIAKVAVHDDRHKFAEVGSMSLGNITQSLAAKVWYPSTRWPRLDLRPLGVAVP